MDPPDSVQPWTYLLFPKPGLQAQWTTNRGYAKGVFQNTFTMAPFSVQKDWILVWALEQFSVLLICAISREL